MKIFLVALVLFTSSSVFGKSLKVAFGDDRPPYIFEEKKELKGIEVDIIREALLLSGHSINYEKLPNKRLDIATSKMDYDLAVGVLDENDTNFYSNDYMQVKNYAVAKASKKLKLSSVYDLEKVSVGAWPSAWSHCGEDFKKIFAPNAKGVFSKQYFEPLNSESQNRMFWRDRFDVAITSKITFLYYKKSLDKTYDTEQEVVFFDVIQDETKFRVAFRDETIRDDFEKGLNQLKRNKRYRRIFQQYAKAVQE